MGYITSGLEMQGGQSQGPRPTMVGNVFKTPLPLSLNWVIKGLHTQSMVTCSNSLPHLHPLLVDLREVSLGPDLSIEDKERWTTVTCGFPSHPGIERSQDPPTMNLEWGILRLTVPPETKPNPLEESNFI